MTENLQSKPISLRRGVAIISVVAALLIFSAGVNKLAEKQRNYFESTIDSKTNQGVVANYEEKQFFNGFITDFNQDYNKVTNKQRARVLVMFMDFACMNRRFYLISDYVFNFLDINNDDKVTKEEVFERLKQLKLDEEISKPFLLKFPHVTLKTLIASTIGSQGVISSPKQMRSFFRQLRKPLILNIQDYAFQMQAATPQNAMDFVEKLVQRQMDQDPSHKQQQIANYNLIANRILEIALQKFQRKADSRQFVDTFMNILLEKDNSSQFAAFTKFLFQFIDRNADNTLQNQELIKFVLWADFAQGNIPSAAKVAKANLLIKNKYFKGLDLVNKGITQEEYGKKQVELRQNILQTLQEVKQLAQKRRQQQKANVHKVRFIKAKMIEQKKGHN